MCLEAMTGWKNLASSVCIPEEWITLRLVHTAFLSTSEHLVSSREMEGWKDNDPIEKRQGQENLGAPHPTPARDQHHTQQPCLPATHQSFWSLQVGCRSPSHSKDMPRSPRSLKLRSSSRRWELSPSTAERPSQAAELSRQMPSLGRH